MFARYSFLLEKRPITTKVITSGCISALGDLICQYTESHLKIKNETNTNNKESSLKIDWKRNRTFLLWGAVVIAPFLHVAYAKVFPYLVPELTTLGAMKKLALD